MNTPIGADYESAAPWLKSPTVTCKTCKGEGQIPDRWEENELVDCPDCDGSGEMWPDYEGD